MPVIEMRAPFRRRMAAAFAIVAIGLARRRLFEGRCRRLRSDDRSRVTEDVETLAEAQLGRTKLVVAARYDMVADLDPGQRKTYRDLVACCGGPP